jgi:hypothetical protein
MTEAEARAALQASTSFDRLEHWIAAQPWQPAADGWIVAGDLGGWRFRLRPIPGGLRVSASAPGGGAPAVWVVPGRCERQRQGSDLPY